MNIELLYSEGQMLLIDKPLFWTSFEVIRKVRKLINIRKVGHAGTLDPLATGLLIVCTGKFTKKINEYMAKEKEYTGTITIGATTPTFDREVEPGNFTSFEHVTEQQVYDLTGRFTGEIMQLPPIHSAIKQDGVRVYELARQGLDVKMKPRKITIQTFEITKIDLPVISFRVVCSTGTYIRSLANDFGEALGCGGYLSSLRRTRIGEYEGTNALTIEQLEVKVRKEWENE
ncbi:MAG: tRNA pseudouridine(55) synthase TruB [Chitinophagaceae bacterium]